MYIRTEYDCGLVKQIELRYPGRYGAPGEPRRRRSERTPEQIEKQNEANRIKKLQRLILANFRAGKSWHMILNYKKENRPDTIEEAKKIMSKFIRRIKKEYKAAGKELKWIAVTERGKRGNALHHHIIIEDLEGIQEKVQKLWKYGNSFWSDIYEEGAMEQLASYMVKKENKGEKDGTRYTHSRNLIIPKPKRKIMRRRRWPENPTVPKGWILIKDTLIDGINPVTGYPYRHYSIRKIKGELRT